MAAEHIPAECVTDCGRGTNATRNDGYCGTSGTRHSTAMVSVTSIDIASGMLYSLCAIVSVSNCDGVCDIDRTTTNVYVTNATRNDGYSAISGTRHRFCATSTFATACACTCATR